MILSNTIKRVPRPYQWLILIAIVLLGAYLCGYGVARHRQLLVHRAAYANGKTDSHRIDTGDWGNGFNPNSHLAQICYWGFSPLRWIEAGYWHLRHPVDSPWPY